MGVPGGLVVKISPSNARNVGSIPGQGAEIPHAAPPKRSKHKNNPKKSKHKNKKQYCNTFNKDFKNDPHQKILKKKKKKPWQWTSLVVQQLRLCSFTAEGMSSIPSQGKTTGRVVRPKERKVMTSS